MSNIAWIIATGLFCTIEIGKCQARRCVDGFELSFHWTAVTYNGANKACARMGGSTVQIRSQSVQRVINQSGGGGNLYFIGLTWKDKKFTWRNGKTPVESGFHNWKSGQPDGPNERCVITNPTKWEDISCGGQYFYICEKEAEVKLSAEYANLSYEQIYKVNCSTRTGESFTPVIWEKDGDSLVASDGKLQLWIRNISNTGTYSCRTKTGCSTPKYLHVTVEGSPKILHVNPESCSSNLIVDWAVHRMARGYLHKIFIYPDGFNETSLELTPAIANGDEMTNITGLLPSTNYTVKIVACRDEDDCPEDLSSSAWNITRGVSSAVLRATFTPVNDSICILSWQEPMEVGDVISKYEITFSEQFVTSRSQLREHYSVTNSRTTSFAIDRLPNRNISASLIAISCAGKSASVDAGGGCYRQPEAPAELLTPWRNYVSNTSHLRFAVPSEENGTMSCLIVIISDVTHGGDSEGSTTAGGNRTGIRNIHIPSEYEYIAVVIPASEFAFKSELDVPLGNNKTTSCNLYVTTHNSSNSTEQTKDHDTIFATNRALDDDITYKIQIMAAVPFGGKVSFARSSYLYLYPPTTDDNSGALAPSLQMVIICTAFIIAFLAVNLAITVVGKRKIAKIFLAGADESKEESALPKSTQSTDDAKPEMIQ